MADDGSIWKRSPRVRDKTTGRRDYSEFQVADCEQLSRYNAWTPHSTAARLN